MKINYSPSRHLFLFISLCSCLLFFTQCKSTPEEVFKSKGGLRVLAGLNESVRKTGGESVEVRNQIMEMLRDRIEYYGVTPHMAWLEDENCILLELPGVHEPERVLNLLQSNGNLEFWETYNLTEIYSELVTADEHLAELLASTVKSGTEAEQAEAVSDEKSAEAELPKSDLDALLASIEEESEDEESMPYDMYAASHPLLAKLQINAYNSGEGYALQPGPIVGYTMMNDKDEIMEYLNMKEVKQALPTDLIFKLGVKPVDEKGEIYELYALKKMREGAIMDGSVITEVKAESGYRGDNVVNLQMNDEGARMWARVTKDNIGKCIAMTVDDRVYSAPNVMSEITGGSSMITGNFTKEEAKDLASILRAGRMPIPVTIIEHKIIPPGN